MPTTFDFISTSILGNIADAIRFVESSTADIAPVNYAERIRAIDKLIPQPDVLNLYMPNGGTVSLNKTGSPTVVELEYSIDRGSTWTIWQPDNDGNRSLVLSAGQRMYLRNTSDTQTTFSNNTTNFYQFAFTDTVEANGNVNSILCKNPESVTYLSDYCYYELFKNCTPLVTAPELPATTLSRYCYTSMFENTSLVTAPELPATTFAASCCQYMFRYCSSLKVVKTNTIDISATNCIFRWLLNVAAQGDFYCPAELTIPTGGSGIPSGWTRHDI